MKRTTRLRLARVAGISVAVGVCAFTVLGSQADWYPGAPTLNRAAQGDLSVHGGARREAKDQTNLIRTATQNPGAKNIIMIIGDGMGSSEITIGRNYLQGAGGAMALDNLPMSGHLSHYSLHKNGKPDYDPDSAATGTAWATGTKTYDNAVSVDINENPQKTILELAKEAGRATGNVTTSDIQDATPAVLVSKVNLRSCYGPTATTKNCPKFAKENGGLGSISEQLLDARPDVTIGGGNSTFDEAATAGEYKGIKLSEQAVKRGYNYATDKAALDEVKSIDDKPFMGLFSKGNMPVKFAPYIAAKGDPTPQGCQMNPEWSKVPALGDMTKKSIDLLASSKKGKSKGFFLQIESASIDKKDHAKDVCGQIGETAQLDDAVTAALDFAKKDGNTLVIVTADHAHTSQIVDGPTPGYNTAVITKDGVPMFVSYGTSDGVSQQHTGADVPVRGFGPGAANLNGTIDQTDLFFIMRDGMKVWDFNNYGKK